MKRTITIAFCLLSLLLCMAQGALYPLYHDNIDVFYAKYRYGYEFIGIKKIKGKLSKIRKIQPEVRKPLLHEPRLHAAFNHLLDSIGHIDWDSDTVVVVIPEDDVGDVNLVKSKKGIVCLYSRGYDTIDDDYYFGTRDFQDYLHMCGDEPCPPYLVKQDSIKSYSLLSFDFDVISNVLSYSFQFGSAYSIFRVIIEKGKIIDTKMLIVPRQLYWRAGPSDWPGQKYHEEKLKYEKDQFKKYRSLKNRIKRFFRHLQYKITHTIPTK